MENNSNRALISRLYRAAEEQLEDANYGITKYFVERGLNFRNRTVYLS